MFRVFVSLIGKVTLNNWGGTSRFLKANTAFNSSSKKV